MAQFKPAFDITMEHEGGYVSDPDDFGGETYRGISRRYHPTWAGWGFIDGMRNEETFPLCLDRDDALDHAVTQFYKELYWDRFQGDKLTDQDLANKMFDIAVNMGVHRAVLFLQSALNLLNRNQKIYADIVEDGLLGKGTLRALEGYQIQEDDFKPLLKIVNILQGYYYVKQMRKHPTQEKYARGWLKRVAL